MLDRKKDSLRPRTRTSLSQNVVFPSIPTCTQFLDRFPIIMITPPHPFQDIANLCWSLGTLEEPSATSAALATHLGPVAALLLPDMEPRQVANVLWGLGRGGGASFYPGEDIPLLPEVTGKQTIPSGASAVDPVINSLKRLSAARAKGMVGFCHNGLRAARTPFSSLAVNM